MFKKAVGSAIVLLLLAVLYLAYYSFYILPKDIAKYQQYLRKAEESSSKGSIEPTEQLRQGIQKDIWHMHEGKQLHYQIKATHSTLSMIPSGKTLTFQEKLEGIDCLLQEKLYTNAHHAPMQQVRRLYATEGLYDFQHHHFVADKIHVAVYTLPGHHLPLLISQDPFLKGHAKGVLLTLSSAQGPAFHADKFIASMDPDKKSHQ